jgi:hypothetical protein
MTCRITQAQINGWRAVKLANAAIEVTVLPDKGADIYAFADVASGIDVLLKTPWGLLPPGSASRRGSHGDKFSQNYEGGWQELLPNTGPSCYLEEQYIAMHGEVATIPWTTSVECADAERVRLRLDVCTRFPPLALTRHMTLSAFSPVLTIEETVRNLSDRTVSFVWGHHPVLGPPFVEADCQMHVAPCTVHTPKTPFDPASTSYAPGQCRPWPWILGLDGSVVDLRAIPGRDANIHDHACLTDLSRGWVAVENSRLGLTFSLEWDPCIFRWVNNWRPLGGSLTPPLEGIYGIAVEPWSARGNLAEAIASRTALLLDGAGTLSTWLRAGLHSSASTLQPRRLDCLGSDMEAGRRQ